MTKPLETHDERQSAYRGDGPDADPSGHGHSDPSGEIPRERSDQGWHPRGHGKGGSLGEGEPGEEPQRDGSTQPNFGQSGSYGKDGGTAAPTAGLDKAGDPKERGGGDDTGKDAG